MKKGKIVYLQYSLSIVILMGIIPRMIIRGNGIEWNRLTYFTIQTNLIMAVYWFLAAQRPERLKKQWFAISGLMSTVAITMVCVLYFIFLHGTSR